MTDVIEMTQDEFNDYLEENGIDENHKEYDNIWCAWMFGGKNPNELIEKIRSEYRGTRETTKEELAELQKEEDERNWFLNHPSA